MSTFHLQVRPHGDRLFTLLLSNHSRFLIAFFVDAQNIHFTLLSLSVVSALTCTQQLQNAKLAENEFALQTYSHQIPGSAWAPVEPSQLEAAADTLKSVLVAMRQDLEVVDYDDHLQNVALDWQNIKLGAALSKLL